MTIPQKYFHDKAVLFLLTINTFLAVLTTMLVGLRLSSGRGQSFTVQYRSNLGINAFKFGGVTPILAFVLFSLVVAVLHFLLSVRVYHVRRNLAIATLSLGSMLLLLALVVSLALLTQR